MNTKAQAPAPDPGGDADTIVAVATAPGRGGIGIVRLSGPAVPRIAETLLGRLPVPRHATLSAFRGQGGADLDHGIALYFPAPHSYTGEDVLELHGHGSPVVLDALVERACDLGARPARAGEYSERAFLNGRIDLAQAEAVADLINSATRAAAAGALRSLHGHFSRRIDDLLEALIETRTLVEAALDFSDEDLPLPAPEAIAAQLETLRLGLAALREQARSGAVLRDGVHIALAGAPNVGKSSLLNALARTEAAIVSEQPGTTRDPVRVDIDLDGVPVHVVDTAGLRKSPDQVESEGIRRAREAMERADIVLHVLDDTSPGPAAPMPELDAWRDRLVLVRNKIDRTGTPPGVSTGEGLPVAALSAVTGSGLPELERYLRERLGLASAGEGTFTARRRHLEALAQAQAAVETAAAGLQRGIEPELVAEDLRRAQEALGQITGVFVADDLLGRIFAGFCIGK